MSDKLKIKLSIADRVYPLTVNTSQEEGLRSATKKIDDMISKLEQSYAVRDKQDLLAMCALQFAALDEDKQKSTSDENENAMKRLKNLDRKLSELLTK